MNVPKAIPDNTEFGLVQHCTTGAGSVEITKGKPVALVGPLPEPMFAIPCATARFAVEEHSDASRTMELPPFSLLFLPRGTLRLGFSGRTEVILVRIGSSAGSSNVLESYTAVSERRDQEIFTTARMLRKHLQNTAVPSVDYIESCLHLLSFQIEQQLSQEPVSRRRSKLNAQDWHDALNLIDERLDQSISVTELAAQLGLSPSQCSRAFKAAIGYPPRDYIRERKLHRARELLVSSQEPLADIALASGFCSQAHMTSIFSKMLGMTPARYRKVSGPAVDAVFT